MLVVLLALGALPGCAAPPPPPIEGSSASPRSPLGSPFADRAVAANAPLPIILDRTDVGIGTSVLFRRVPTVGEIHDLQLDFGFQHLVLALPGWPAGPEVVEPLQQLEEGSDAIVVLPGYPPSRAAVEAWNLLGSRVRIVVLVDGPPPSPGVVQDFNAMRGLERVVARLERPSRAGFERLQRPLSFLKVVE
jgi:hypothetical protein